MSFKETLCIGADDAMTHGGADKCDKRDKCAACHRSPEPLSLCSGFPYVHNFFD